MKSCHPLMTVKPRYNFPGIQDIPRALADRAVLQGAEAEPAGEDVPGDDGERGADAALDGIDSHVADEAAANALPARVVSVAPYSGVPRLHVRAQGLAKMAGRPGGAEAAEAALRLWFVFGLAIWTAGGAAAGNGEQNEWFPKRGQVLEKAITGQRIWVFIGI